MFARRTGPETRDPFLPRTSRLRLLLRHECGTAPGLPISLVCPSHDQSILGPNRGTCHEHVMAVRQPHTRRVAHPRLPAGLRRARRGDCMRRHFRPAPAFGPNRSQTAPDRARPRPGPIGSNFRFIPPAGPFPWDRGRPRPHVLSVIEPAFRTPFPLQKPLRIQVAATPSGAPRMLPPQFRVESESPPRRL